MAALFPYPKFRGAGADGLPLVGGKLYAYAAGTSTPLATYTDKTESGANTNPVILDSRGEAGVWLKSGDAYKLVLKDSADVVIWTVDDVSSLPDDSVTLAKIANGALANSTAGRLKMGDGFLSATSDGLAKMAAGFLQATADGLAKMADGFLSADTAGRLKMADGFITPQKLAALGQQLSNSSGVFTTPWDGAHPNYTYPITNLSVSLTTTGRPVFVAMIPDAAGGDALIQLGSTVGGTPAQGRIILTDGATSDQITGYVAAQDTDAPTVYNEYFPSGPFGIFLTPSGSHTFSAAAQMTDAWLFKINYMKLIAFEL